MNEKMKREISKKEEKTCSKILKLIDNKEQQTKWIKDEIRKQQ